MAKKRKSTWDRMTDNASKQWDRLVGNTYNAIKQVPTGVNLKEGKAHTVGDATDELRAYKMKKKKE